MNNQKCKIRSEIIDINSNESLFYPYSIEINKCSGSCNNINYPYPKRVPDVVKNINVQVFNLKSRTHETRHMEWHQTCKCKCTLDASIKQRWNKNKCRCECKELIDKGICDKGFIWNPSNCDCNCDKSCDVGEYLDYKNCKFRKKLVDKLVEECSENIDENETIYNKTLSDYERLCHSCTIYIVLFVIFVIFFIHEYER